MPGRHVSAQLVVRARLVGHHVGNESPVEHGGEDVGRVPQQADGERPTRRSRLARHAHGPVQSAALRVEVAGFEPPRDPPCVDLHADHDPAVHRDRERLRAAHAAQTGAHHDAARERGAELLLRERGEGLVGALQDALGADVDPRAGGHLAVHHQALSLQLAEVLPVRPSRHEVGVGDHDPGRHPVRAEHAHGLARLHEEGFVVREVQQRAHDGVEAVPIARCPSRSAVDHEPVGVLGVLGIEVVAEHAQGRFLQPPPAGDRPAARRPHRPGAAAPHAQVAENPVLRRHRTEPPRRRV